MSDIYCHTSSPPSGVTLEELESFTARVNEAVKAASTLPPEEEWKVRTSLLLKHNEMWESYMQTIETPEGF